MCWRTLKLLKGHPLAIPRRTFKGKEYLVLYIYSKETNMILVLLSEKESWGGQRIAYSHCISPTRWVWGSFPYSLIHLLLRLPRPGIASKRAGLQRMILWGNLSKTCHNQESMFSQEGWPAPRARGCKHRLCRGKGTGEEKVGTETDSKGTAAGELLWPWAMNTEERRGVEGNWEGLWYSE